jgi:DNA-binding IclR family transcriptional regulator
MRMSAATRLPGTAAEGAQTVRRAMALLRLVATGQEQGVRLTDVAQMSGLSRPTAHRLLKVLIDESAVEQDAATRRYRIGPELVLLGLARSSGLPIRSVADPLLRELSQQVGDTVFLTVRHGTDSVCVARHPGHHAIQVLSIEVGVRRPLGASVSGVVLLAALPPADSRAITQALAPRLQPLGLTPAEVDKRVQAARALGHAVAEQGVVPGTRALAVPVQDALGQVVAVISIAAMADRLDRKRRADVLALMQQQAQRITQRLQSVPG